MARLLSLAQRSLSLKTLTLPPSTIFSSSRSYISEMRRSAFTENLLRLLRTEIAYQSEYRPPQPPVKSFDSFLVEDSAGEQSIRLRRKYCEKEDIKIDATMFDAVIPSKLPAAAGGEDEPRLHISVVVEVSKSEPSSTVLQFLCSAWSDSLEVENVFPVLRGPAAAIMPFMGPRFKEMDDELQDAILSYLEERGVNDYLAEFLHDYMINKEKSELIHWIKNVESYVKK